MECVYNNEIIISFKNFEFVQKYLWFLHYLECFTLFLAIFMFLLPNVCIYV